jgi:hypothetical protein
MRITIDIDDRILLKLKELQRRDGHSLGRLVSDLLAQTLSTEAVPEAAPRRFVWIAKPLGPRIDLEDKDAIRNAMA